jgi:hypothetical protein
MRASASPLFPLGRIVATRGAAEKLSPADIWTALEKHIGGNWGELDESDRTANDQALQDGSRLLSAYRSEYGMRFWIITEADRSVTTVLLPGEY